MIIKSLVVSNGSYGVKSTIIDWMPDLPNDRPWNHFSNTLENRSLLNGAELVLLELTEHENEKNFSAARTACRSALKTLSVEVHYTDVYRTKFKPYSKKLDWFGRHEIPA